MSKPDTFLCVQMLDTCGVKATSETTNIRARPKSPSLISPRPGSPQHSLDCPACFGYEKVVRFDVSVQYALIVNKFQWFQTHLQIRFDITRRQNQWRISNDCLKITLQILKHLHALSHSHGYFQWCTRLRLLLCSNTSSKRTILGCCNSFSNLISLKAVICTP